MLGVLAPPLRAAGGTELIPLSPSAGQDYAFAVLGEYRLYCTCTLEEYSTPDPPCVSQKGSRMPHEPTAPAGVRFFARIDRFHCECPSCGALVVGDLDPRRSHQRDLLAARANKTRRTQTTREKARHNPDHPYNPFTQVLTCPLCGKSYGVGLLLWSFTKAPGHHPPSDTQPSRRELAQLRQYAESRWPWQAKRSGEEVNVYVEPECPCVALDRRDPACPIHGDSVIYPWRSNATSGPPIGGKE